MSKATQIPVKDLSLDLSNFRTVPQRNENHAVQTMIALRPDRFWALTESLIDDGYLATENILVLRRGKSKMIVKEGNRRVAALKLIQGILPIKSFSVPAHIKEKILNISPDWEKNNQKIPCTVYEAKDAEKVDHIVQLAHGKGEKAGRDQWNAVARARHNRDVGKISEPSLDLLERYLAHGKNLTDQERDLWTGDYPLSVLFDAIKRIASRFPGIGSTSELAKKYPSIQNRDGLERLINDIGNQNVTHAIIRNKSQDFGISYGLPPIVKPPSSPTPSGVTPDAPPTAPSATPSSGATTSGSPATPSTTPSAVPATPSGSGKPIAVAINDPESVKRALKAFMVLGDKRDKVVSLRNEALEINLKKTPLAFCFLLRSMFEISAKAYCDDHVGSNGPKYQKSDGKDRRLVDILDDISKHIIQLPDGDIDKNMQKTLHGAMVELGKPEGVLSVTSLNHLVHNPSFSVTAGDISTIFGNVFPLLVLMNQ